MVAQSRTRILLESWILLLPKVSSGVDQAAAREALSTASKLISTAHVNLIHVHFKFQSLKAHGESTAAGTDRIYHRWTRNLC